jgi:hypothetical protein
MAEWFYEAGIAVNDVCHGLSDLSDGRYYKRLVLNVK